MANPPKPWKAEYAKSSRSSCKTCNSPIDKEILRFGKLVQSTQFEGFMPMWHHASCILRKADEIKNVEDVEGLKLLSWEDQQKIRKYVEAGGSTQPPTNASTPSVTECGIETSQTNRASCRKCTKKITKGEVRVSVKLENQNARSLGWHHVKCFKEMHPTVELSKVAGWNTLLAADQAAVSSTAKGKKTGADKEPLQGSNGGKRKRNSGNKAKSKVAKLIGRR
jgi:poly [ADP-ribose] polymerase